MNRLMRAVTMGLCSLALPSLPHAPWNLKACIAEEASPKSIIDQTINELVVVVEKLPGDEHTKERRDALRQVINPHFDFSEMAKRSLGSNWNQASADQRREFVEIFSDLLAKTYLNKVELIRRGTVTVEREHLFPPTGGGTLRAAVNTTVTYKGDDFPIDYRLYNLGKGWKVYDVIIENIGLVSNYRTEFNGIVRKKGIDGLISDLRKKE